MGDSVIAGRYRIEQLVAEGGMAKVYRGTDERLGRTVAIKILSAELAGNEQFVARFEAEARAAASLDHPNVVRIFDTGQDRGRHYIVMQFVSGPTLWTWLAERGPLVPAEAVRIAVRVCAALAAAHEKGIVHRDVKPGNIMLEDHGTVKVMDFGIAKTAMGGLTQVGDVLGTAAYLSPEQARGDQVDFRSDLYSVGCVLYQMLTGRPPLAGESLLEVANRLETEQPAAPSELNPAIGPELDRIVLRALAKDPGQRFESALQLQEALEAVAAGRTPVAAPMPALPTDPRTVVMPSGEPGRPAAVRGMRWALVGLIGVVALIAGASMVWSSMNSGSAPAAAPPTPTAGAASPSASPSPAPPAEDSGETAVLSAIDGLWSLVESSIASGDMTDDAGEEILEEVVKARSEYQKQDHPDAVRRIGEAREELAKFVEDDEISPVTAGRISELLDRLQRLVSL